MKPYVLIAAGLLWGASALGAFFYGQKVGDDQVTAQVAREDKLVAKASAAAASAAAIAIAGIEVKNVTVQQKLQREVLTREVFRDCRSGSSAVELLTAAPGIAQSGSAAAGRGQLPAAGAAH